MGRTLVALCVLFLSGSGATGASSWLDISFRGYLKDLLSISEQQYGLGGSDQDWAAGNVLHMRQNLRWFPLESVTCGIEVKTRHFLGENIRSTVEYNEGLSSQATYFDWTWFLVEEDNSSLVTTVDRAWIESYLGPAQFTVGRQRIAWGTNLVWNPVDLFNPVSPFDFDSEERPGADAARVQYYTSPTSKLEFAVAPGRESWRSVVAGLYRINRWEYDFYLVGGWWRSSGVVGGAWAGQVRGAGFRGEWLYAHPSGGWQYTEPFTLAAISGDYTFPNSLYLHGEALYNSEGTTGEAGRWRLWEAIERGELSPGRVSLFDEVAYSFTPLVRGSLSGILNPFDHSWYLGPAVYWSLTDNLDLNLSALLFEGEEGTEFGDMGEILFASIKYSF